MHISDIKKFLRCPRLYCLSQNEKREHFSYFNISEDIDHSIAEKLGIETYATGQVNQSNEETFEIIKSHTHIFKARFSYHGLRVKIPLIKIAEGNCCLYFIYLQSNVNEEDLLNITLCKQVVESCGLHVDDIQILYLNSQYRREENLNHKNLWKQTGTFPKKGKTILEVVNENFICIDELIEPMLHFDDEDFIPSRTSKCSGRNKCTYYDNCFPDERKLEKNSILHLVSSQHKYEMYADGIRYLKDADLKRVEGNKVQYAQIRADQMGGLYIDKIGVRNWIEKKISYPIAFVDFEWDLYPIPPFKGMRPMDVLVFQYSLDVDDGTSLKHYQFIGEGDCRKEFIESLLSNLPKTGSVVAYNAVGAEMLRLNELGEIFTEYRKQLSQINERMVDLAAPFGSGMVYNTEMAGSFTLKTIESIVDCEHSYSQLECENGLEAVDIHRKLCECKDPEEKENYRQQLYEYCGLDSYSMIKVYQYLLKNSTE